MKTLKPLSPILLQPSFKKLNQNYMQCFLNFRVYNYKYNNNTVNTNKTSTSTSTPKPTSTLNLSSILISWEGPSPSLLPALKWNPDLLEHALEKVIFRFRFVTFLGVFGSLVGSILCFIKGCANVVASFVEHFAKSGKAISFLIEAVDVYLLGTVMLVFGMGLYELFVSNLDIAKSPSHAKHQHQSNLFGLFTLRERPQWLEIKTVNELKTKVGHVIVMLLLIGLFDHCKKAAIHTPTDLLCFSASVLLCSGCLYLLSKL